MPIPLFVALRLPLQLNEQWQNHPAKYVYAKNPAHNLPFVGRKYINVPMGHLLLLHPWSQFQNFSGSE